MPRVEVPVALPAPSSPPVAAPSSAAGPSAPATPARPARAGAAPAAPATPAAPKAETRAPPAEPALAAPPLDLKGLELRLKETSAIGVFTKLALKNQVDDLLAQFRAFHRGQSKPSLVELRRPYDMLLLKVLALLQDSDPPLARAIASSRESIWGILSNPARFASI